MNSFLLIFLGFLSLTLATYKPYSTIDPANARRKHVTHPVALSDKWGSNLKRPYPTNIWWLNLVLKNGDQTVNTYPYISKVKLDTFCFSYPSFLLDKKYVIALYSDEWCMQVPKQGHKVTDYNDLGVIVEYPSGDGKKAVIPFTQGSAFVVAEVTNLELKLAAEKDLLEVRDENGQIYHPEQNPVTQPSSKFVIKMANKDMEYHRWVLYLDSKVTLSLQKTSFSSSAPYTGVVKFAIAQEDDLLKELDNYRGAYTMGGFVDYHVEEATAKLFYEWKRKGTGDLLMLAFPHHLEQLVSPKKVDAISYTTVRGKVVGVVGNQWMMALIMPKYTWDSPKPIDESKIAKIRETLQADYTYEAREGDPYFFGVSMGHMAKLALIADQLNDPKADKIRENMKRCITFWITGDNPDALLYDETYGGIVSTKGIQSAMEDFGNGYYNDHHFHYGYHVFAIATIGRKDKDFLNKYKEEILTYARDYGNPSKNDKYFTVARNKDWYAWHSWAAGLFEFADGRNQESTSEAILGYYGLMLLGEAMENNEMKNFGKLLLAMEIVSAQTYWHVPSKSKIYPEIFKPNKMVGVLWANKVDYATFFGANPIFIHGIQMLPFLPPTETCLDKDFIKEEYEVIKGESGPADWMPYKVCAKAIIDPEGAWNEALGLGTFHLGTCRTMVLHWIATRP